MQIAQRRYGDPRLTEFQSRTCNGIEHPTRNRLDFAAVGLDVDDLRSAALFDISDLDALAVQWMPTIADFNFLPDMGTINATLRWDAIIIMCLSTRSQTYERWVQKPSHQL
jgi:hypothetical protein